MNEFDVGDLVRVRKDMYEVLSPMIRTLHSMKSDVPLKILDIYCTPEFGIYFYRVCFIDMENSSNEIGHLVTQGMLEPFSEEDDHSEEYKRILEEVKNWPDWKLDIYNKCIAVSKHSRRIDARARRSD